MMSSSVSSIKPMQYSRCLPHGATLVAEGAALRFYATLAPGLYCLEVDADASMFAWDELYIDLHLFGNHGDRTGPWDFDLTNGNRPLLPSYWVSRNGRRVGLWYFNRPSSRQVAKRRLKGEFQFRVEEREDVEWVFEPYRQFSVYWERVSFGLEKYDSLQTVEPQQTPWKTFLPESMPQNEFTEYFLASVDWCARQTSMGGRSGGQAMPVLAAEWKWTRREDVKAALLRGVDYYVDLDHWGNPKEDGYGHDGDMAAAIPFFGLVSTLHWAGDALGERHDAVLKKLVHQGDRFMELAMIHRGYWGGSILQDHGFCSVTTFASAALGLLGIVPRAQVWLEFLLPRIRRSLEALPADGVIPASSYHMVWLYLEKVVVFRELLLRFSGEDIYQRMAFANLCTSLRRFMLPNGQSYALPSPRGDVHYLDGAQAFFAQMLPNPDAAWLLERLMQPANITRPRLEFAEWHLQKEWLWAMICTRRPAAAEPAPPPPNSDTEIFRDAGVAIMRDQDLCAIAVCGPPGGHSAHRNATSPCDRAYLAPMAGHFILLDGDQLILRTAEGGYQMKTELGNVLLVNGGGQNGDIGMPMSYPDVEWSGEGFMQAETQPAICCDLKPAYAGMAAYTREIFFRNHEFFLRDEVTPSESCDLEWRFQLDGATELSEESDLHWRAKIGDRTYELHFQIVGAQATSRSQNTHTVWGYVKTDAQQECRHIAVCARKCDRPIECHLRLARLE